MLDVKRMLTTIPQMLKPTEMTGTKVGNYYSGNLRGFMRGGVVTICVSISRVATSSRTTIAKIPTGCRPPMETYGFLTNNDIFVITVNGEIQINAGSATNLWGVATFVATQ